MVTFKGWNTKVAFVAEASYGAGGTVDTAIGGKVLGVTIEEVNNFQREVGLGEGRNDSVTLFGQYDANLTVDWEVGDFNFLQFAVGPRNNSLPGSTASPCSLSEADNVGYGATDLKTFAIAIGSEAGATDDEDTFDGCIIDSFTLSGSVGDILRCSCRVLARAPTSDTSANSITPSTIKPFVFQQGAFKWNSATVAKVQNFSVTYSNNLFTYWSLGSRFKEQPETGRRKYDFTVTVKMTDTIATTLRDHFYGQANSPYAGIVSASPTEYNMQLNIQEGSSSGNRVLNVYVNNCAIERFSKSVDLGGGIVEVTFSGFGRTGGNTNKPFEWFTTT